MLVLTRKIDESIWIEVGGKTVRILVVDVRGKVVRLGVEADKDVVVNRETLNARSSQLKTSAGS